LIVGLNSDSSVKRLKGDQRPVNNQKERAYLLACLCFVDHVVIFNDDTPYSLIQAIMPDYLVKGGDWKPQDIVGSDIVWENGGDVKSLPFVKGFSTTATIERIKELADQ
jgi:rfaE bifunctional protein nucleotidyltransferase chain/domain